MSQPGLSNSKKLLRRRTVQNMRGEGRSYPPSSLLAKESLVLQAGPNVNSQPMENPTQRPC